MPPEASRPVARRSLWAVALLIVLAAAALVWMKPGWVGLGEAPQQSARRGAGESRAAPVEVVAARTERVEDQVEALGTLIANEQVAIAPEVSGRIVAFHFQEGQQVKAGDDLVDLDPAIAAADLKQAQANLSLAEDVFERSQTLVQRGAGTQVALEQATAQLAVARANVTSAETRLAQLKLKAPFAGIVGLRTTSVGTIVPAGQAVTTLTSIDPMKVDFSIPELFLSAVKAGQSIDVVVDAVPDRRFTGEVYAIDPVVDVAGRAVRLRATIANADRVLRPGLFARVALTTAVRDDAVVVPETALVAAATGQEAAVYVVSGERAAMRVVTTGRRFDGKVEITEGVKAGEQVVTAGQARLRDGARVVASAPPDRNRPAGPREASASEVTPAARATP